MSTLRWILMMLGVLAGAALGWQRARLQIDSAISAMIEHVGWVCGTGLDTPYYVWIPFGAMLGVVFGDMAWRVLRRFLAADEGQG